MRFPIKRLAYIPNWGVIHQYQDYNLVLNCDFPNARPQDWQSITLFISLKQWISTYPKVGAVLLWDDGRLEAGCLRN